MYVKLEIPMKKQKYFGISYIIAAWMEMSALGLYPFYFTRTVTNGEGLSWIKVVCPDLLIDHRDREGVNSNR
ncbi:hypothetical protein PITCH_A550002 [uncultured Desulfobacterium sp.]|uniref:Uncharacterized protein n=1 Tax=uncultured Desulfobacterium sp. TaxID=201089 RepID=A0A445N0V8_9BACT|nr:hypothetical protein PITCH_A550002 [uncultured Desulfobacterium sp.]